MNKKQFYRLLGKVEAGYTLTQYEVEELSQFAEMIIDQIEAWCEDEPDMFGTEGWEHWVGWD